MPRPLLMRGTCKPVGLPGVESRQNTTSIRLPGIGSPMTDQHGMSAYWSQVPQLTMRSADLWLVSEVLSRAQMRRLPFPCCMVPPYSTMNHMTWKCLDLASLHLTAPHTKDVAPPTSHS